MIPALRDQLQAAVDAKSRIGAIDAEMQELAARICMAGGVEVNPDQVARQKLERVSLLQSVDDAVSQIQRTGCVVKDLEMGLLDFPAMLDGVAVFLCWKLGESRIEWWHSAQEGYSGRRRIIDEFDADQPTLRPN